MTPPVRAWLGGRSRRRAGSLASRLTRLAAAVVLLCALWPAVASARGERRAHADRRAVHPSLRTAGLRVPELHIGSGEATRRGVAAVRGLQRGLRRAGYAPGPVDGRYGPLTAAAVERFQINHRLQVDGIVGPVTWHALRAAPRLAPGAGLTSAHGSSAVARLQRLLRRAGFSPGRIDGRLGPRTERAIIRFQRARHLTADGIAGPVTEHALRAARRTVRHPAGTRASRPGGPPRSARTRQSPSPTRSAPARRTAPPTRASRPNPVQVNAPVPHRPPVVWILIGLCVLGVAAWMTSYLRTWRRVRSARSKWRSGSENASGGRHR